jgi:putative ABC transport system permease protein
MLGLLSSLTLVVRTDVDPTRLIAAVRREIRALDAALPVANVQTLEQHVHKSVAPQRFNTFLLATFALVALILAAIGIYGVMARSVTQRTHEIGVRMALGAQRKDVLRLVVRQGMFLAFSGIAIGMAAALAVTRVLSSFLYNVKPRDPWTFAGVAVLLGLVALLACYLPARRATRVDPVIALRDE